LELNVQELARELLDANANGALVETKPTDRFPGFGLDDAYATLIAEGEIRATGGKSKSHIGYKVGLSNKAVWEKMGLQNIVWGYVFQDTVQFIEEIEEHTITLANTVAPRIEPEIVFRLKGALPADGNLNDTLAAIDAVGLGFEIVDCPYPGWTYKPADMVAAVAFHKMLIVGKLRQTEEFTNLQGALTSFKGRIIKDGQTVKEGGYQNVYDSPLHALAELGKLLAQAGITVQPGEIVTSGTFTDAPNLGVNEDWTIEIEGIELPSFVLHTMD
jgi:2-keto-4-pentenoate hydratase